MKGEVNGSGLKEKQRTKKGIHTLAKAEVREQHAQTGLCRYAGARVASSLGKLEQLLRASFLPTPPSTTKQTPNLLSKEEKRTRRHALCETDICLIVFHWITLKPHPTLICIRKKK